MFLVHCPLDDATRLQGTGTILAMPNTANGIVVAAACRCGGHAILVDGVRRAHRGPAGRPATEPTRLAPVQGDRDERVSPPHDPERMAA